MHTHDTVQEHALVAAAKRDRTAFGALFDQYYQPILRYCVRRTGDVATAEDITAEVFMKALRAFDRYEARDGVPLSAWLYKIATNELRMHYRRSSRQALSLETLSDEQGFEPASDTDIEQEAADAQEALERHEQFGQAIRLIHTMPVKYQEVLVLRYVEQKKISDIALITGRKSGTVKSLLSRGVAKLRGHMQPFTHSGIVSGEDTQYQQSPERNA